MKKSIFSKFLIILCLIVSVSLMVNSCTPLKLGHSHADKNDDGKCDFGGEAFEDGCDADHKDANDDGKCDFGGEAFEDGCDADHKDANDDGKCDFGGEAFEDGCDADHKDANDDGKCDFGGEAFEDGCDADHKDANDDGKCDFGGEAFEDGCDADHKDANDDGKCDFGGEAFEDGCDAKDCLDSDGDGLCDNDSCDKATTNQPAGGANNPIFVDFVWNESMTEATAKVTVPAGKTYYFCQYRIGGLFLSINGGEAILLEATSPMMPVTFTVTNSGAEEAEYTLALTYPVGTMNNPEILFRPSYIGVNIAAGNNQGYYYKWTAMDSGKLTITCPTVEGVQYDVILTNMSNYAMAWLSDSTDGTVSMDVSAGDEIIIQVVAVPNSSFEYPALETALSGTFAYPVGHHQNPEVIEELDWRVSQVSQPAGNSMGYFYTWTAPFDGTVIFYFNPGEDIKGALCDISLTNLTTYVQKTLLEDGVDYYGLEVSMDVKAGDEILISMIVIQDAEGNYYPAADFEWCGSFTYPVGTEKNPFYPYVTWDDAHITASGTFTVPAGETLCVGIYPSVIATLNGEYVTPNSDSVIFITNDSESDAEYTLTLYVPEGTYDNPQALELGNNSIILFEGNMGYYYTWTAPASGYFTFEIYSENWFYCINNMTTYVFGDNQWSDSDPAMQKYILFVNEGDVLQIIVNTYDPANFWTPPTDIIEFNATFSADSESIPTA